MDRSRYTIYAKHKNYKSGRFVGVSTDDLERAKEIVDCMKKAKYANIYDWFRVKDTVTNKYVYEV